jgi:signal transduction histidine kinase
MLRHSPEATKERVLIYAPTERDAESTYSALTDAGLNPVACPTLEALSREIEAGAGTALLTAEEPLTPSALETLQAVFDRQEPWSDLPLIMLASSGSAAHTLLETLPSSGNLVLLGRPVPMSTLVSAVRAALQARRRQYRVRDLIQGLEATSRQKDEFLAMLAHELRNPLAPLSNAVQLMRMRGTVDPATERFRDLVERQVLQLRRLVDDLLDVSRLTRGKIELRRARLDLSYLVRQTVEDHRDELTAAGLDLSMELPEEPVWIEGDAARLTQALSNLLLNRAKFTPSGGQVSVRLRIDEGPDPNHHPWAAITVRDTGAGINPEFLPHVFDSFTQADHGTDHGSGLGLGLTLVKQLLELHGGSVTAASEGVGRGTEFSLYLPIAAPAAASAEPLGSDEQPDPRVLAGKDHQADAV